MLFKGGFKNYSSQTYDFYDEHLSHKENRNERSYAFKGVILTSEIGMSTVLFGASRERYVTISDKPSIFQKISAFLLVKSRIADFARKENQWAGYAFSFCAHEIFSW